MLIHLDRRKGESASAFAVKWRLSVLWLTDRMPCRQSLADTLRDMPHQQFVGISERMYKAMMARIELVRVLGEVLGDLLQETR